MHYVYFSESVGSSQLTSSHVTSTHSAPGYSCYLQNISVLHTADQMVKSFSPKKSEKKNKKTDNVIETSFMLRLKSTSAELPVCQL